MGTWEDKCHHFRCTPLLSPSPSFIWTWRHMVQNIHLVSWGWLPCPSLPNFFCTPSLLSAEVGLEAEYPLALGKHCSGITKISLYYQQVFTGKPKQPHTSYYKENWLYHNQIQDNCWYQNLCEMDATPNKASFLFLCYMCVVPVVNKKKDVLRDVIPFT